MHRLGVILFVTGFAPWFLWLYDNPVHIGVLGLTVPTILVSLALLFGHGATPPSDQQISLKTWIAWIDASLKREDYEYYIHPSSISSMTLSMIVEHYSWDWIVVVSQEYKLEFTRRTNESQKHTM